MANKWLPIMYCTYFGMFKDSAEKHGYCLSLHGSLTRDFDLILIPWIEHPSNIMEVFKDWNTIIGHSQDFPLFDSKEIKPHGRISYTISCGAGGYIDVSVINGISKD